MRLSVIIPCYNEALNIPTLLDRCAALLDEPGIEVILVDNGSNDGSDAVLVKLLPLYPSIRSVRVEVNQGYGYGILFGLRAAKGKMLAWTHADLQTDPKDVLKGLEILQDKGEGVFVKGRRYGRSLTDNIFTIGMSVFETILLRCPLWDINAQPTMFSRRFFESWGDPPLDFSLDLYAYYKASEVGLDIRRFPVRFDDRIHGSSNWNVDWAGKRKFIRRTIDFSLKLRRKCN